VSLIAPSSRRFGLVLQLSVSAKNPGTEDQMNTPHPVAEFFFGVAEVFLYLSWIEKGSEYGV